ncbi:MAG: type II toxin-antitoxin system VapC family toxin [Chloroflexi bacterium]|nr:type II toxin-antitoxin system VapC family toxin [Chloroflexota bacterium]
MSAILLDTTVLIDLLRGRRGAAGRLRRLRAVGDQPYTCAINVEEVVRGLREPEAAAARSLFTGLRIVALDAVEGWRAGEWRRSLGAEARTLSQADCLVAAAASSIGGRVATGNPTDFPMPGLAVEHWPVGE